MKKTLIIGGAVLGFLLTAALVICVFFPGLPAFFKVKHQYKHINEKPNAFEIVPARADFKEFTLDGIKLKAPADCSLKLGGSGLKSASGEAELVVLQTNNKEQDETLDSFQDYDPWDTYKYEQEDYKVFFRSIGTEPPQYGFSSKILFYIRDYINAADCIRLRGKNKDIFFELADLKEKAMEAEDMQKLKSNNFTEYIGRIQYSGYEDMWHLFIFPDGDDINTYLVTINCADETTAKQIISSIELE